MENMSKAEAAAEQKKWATKHFDFAENPVKEWIAETFGEDVDTLFDDYNEDADVLNVKSGDDSYTLYLTTTPTTSTAYTISRQQLQSDEILQRATSMMYDAVFTVFMPIVNTMTNMKHLVEDIFPRFEESTMSFKMLSVNGPYMHRKQLEQTLKEINTQTLRLKSIVTTDENIDEIKKLQNKLQIALESNTEKFNSITDEECKNAQLVCDERNKTFATSTRLYVCIEKNKKDIVLEQKLKRLPQFGLKYQDPDEDTYVDRFKKEHNINI